MNDRESASAQRLSFKELLKDAVKIPIIQRDYAQGRETAQEVRSTFLGALYQYLDENEPNRDLDFVYGSLIEIEGDKYFIPLDGQQRLTTLFLLHWYLAQLSDNMDKLREVLLTDDKKSMFTYETRPSSSMFCDALLNSDIDFNNLEENSLSKTIKNSSWYYLSWEYDPTIQSMLTMLDAIHKKFEGKRDFFERLIDNRIITFWLLNLKDFKLTDDLYIKMNSRGKPLTPFENFKAKFEQYIDNKIKPDREFYLKFGDDNKNVSLKDYFSYKIDTKWANLFWNYRELPKPEDTFDNELMNFIRVIFTNQYAVSLKTNEADANFEILLKDQLKNISFYKYEELNALTKESVLYLIDAFDNLANENKEIRVLLSENYKYYFNENATFENALRGNFKNYHERLCFHAYVSYLIFNPNDRTGVEQWMRVIHNLTHPDNTIIDGVSELVTAVKSIEKMLPESNDILEYLKRDGEEIVGSSNQILEEKIKAHLITRNSDWKNKIESVEKHKYFNGQIGFILEFSGIIEYYYNNKNCDWNDQENVKYFREFSAYADKAGKVFDESYENRKNNKDYIFERAVLTKGNYLTSASKNRKNLLSTSFTRNNIKRDHSWKRLLRVSDEKDKRLLVKEVFDDKRFDIENLEDSLKSICEDTTNSWRDYFITCPKLIEYCKQGFIRFDNEDEESILLYGESRSCHMHVEMYSYYSWIKYIEPHKTSFLPFNEVKYNDVKSIDDKACIRLSGFCHNEIHYQIDINYCDKSYKISFKKLKDANYTDEYEADIKRILEELEYKMSDGEYYVECKDFGIIKEKLTTLCERLVHLS